MRGFGLGLYLARYFIELHRGEISLHSEPGHGTTVNFQIPFDLEQSKEPQYYFSPQTHTEQTARLEWTS